MKLIFCTKCWDVVKLSTKEVRKCECGQASGKYLEDGLNAEYQGTAVPLGFSNPSLVHALRNQPPSGNGKDFTAFVIPVSCPTMKKVDTVHGNKQTKSGPRTINKPKFKKT